MKTVKGVCKNCGEADEFSQKEMVFLMLKRLLLVPIFVFGLLFVVFMIIVGPTAAMGSVTTSLMMSFTVDGELHDELRHQGINWTNHCYPYDQLCFANGVYDNLDHVPYVQASLISPMQPPEETLEFGGDCKNSAMLFTTVMRSVGADAYVLCNYNEAHCISIVPDVERSKYYVVDLTIPAMLGMEQGMDPWDFKENGTILRY